MGHEASDRRENNHISLSSKLASLATPSRVLTGGVWRVHSTEGSRHAPGRDDRKTTATSHLTPRY